MLSTVSSESLRQTVIINDCRPSRDLMIIDFDVGTKITGNTEVNDHCYVYMFICLFSR